MDMQDHPGTTRHEERQYVLRMEDIDALPHEEARHGEQVPCEAIASGERDDLDILTSDDIELMIERRQPTPIGLISQKEVAVLPIEREHSAGQMPEDHLISGSPLAKEPDIDRYRFLHMYEKYPTGL